MQLPKRQFGVVKRISAATLLLIACFSSAAAAKAEPRSNDFPGFRYVEVVLGGGDSVESLPLIVGLHGMSSKPELFARLFRRGLHVKARLVCPEAPIADRGGFDWSTVHATSGSGEALARDLTLMADRLAQWIPHIRKIRPTSGTTIVVGYSQGGMLALTLALRHPQGLASVISISGWLPKPLRPSHGSASGEFPNLYMFHGTKDTTIPFAWGEDVAHQLESNGFKVYFGKYVGAEHVISADMQGDLLHLLDSVVERQ